MKQYTRVSYWERCQIFALLQVKKPIPEIARLLNRSKSTIYREIKRGPSIKRYRPSLAHRDFLEKKKFRKKQYKIQG